MTSPSPAPAGRPTDETGEAAEALAETVREGFGAHWMIWQDDPNGHTRTAVDDPNCPACLALAALSVLAARAHDAEKALEELRDAARPFAEMAQEMLNGHPTGRLKRGDPERLLVALAGRVGAEQDSEA